MVLMLIKEQAKRLIATELTSTAVTQLPIIALELPSPKQEAIAIHVHQDLRIIRQRARAMLELVLEELLQLWLAKPFTHLLVLAHLYADLQKLHKCWLLVGVEVVDRHKNQAPVVAVAAAV